MPHELSSTPGSTADSAESVTYAPKCARDGRDHLTTIVNALKGEQYSEYTQFNEILSVAYSTSLSLTVIRTTATDAATLTRSAGWTYERTRRPTILRAS